MNRTAPITRSQPYSHRDLRRLIAPSSIAIIGASETIGSFGANTIANLRGKFSGALYPVNPKRTSVFGERCYPAVSSLPENIDCAVVIVPASQVEQTLKECSQHGIGSAIVYSSGFAELGSREAIAAQEAVAHLARSQDIRVIGPNCVGIANVGLRLGLTFMPSFEDLPLKPGPVGIVTQSGALGYMLLQAMRRGVGFSHWLTTGNACDVDVADLVNYLVDDEGTRAIACSFEGLANPDRFLITARRAQARPRRCRTLVLSSAPPPRIVPPSRASARR
jgi:acyl-CoA synthetase (NDP forming)